MKIDSKISELLKSDDDKNKLVGFSMMLGLEIGEEAAKEKLLDCNQDSICKKCLDDKFEGQKYTTTSRFSCEGSKCEESGIEFLEKLGL